MPASDVIATLYFPARPTVRLTRGEPVEEIFGVSIGTIAAMLEVYAGGRQFTAEYVEGGQWRAPIDGVALVLNTFFGADAWATAFPHLACQPGGQVPIAVADLFGARADIVSDDPVDDHVVP